MLARYPLGIDRRQVFFDGGVALCSQGHRRFGLGHNDDVHMHMARTRAKPAKEPGPPLFGRHILRDFGCLIDKDPDVVMLAVKCRPFHRGERTLAPVALGNQAVKGSRNFGDVSQANSRHTPIVGCSYWAEDNDLIAVAGYDMIEQRLTERTLAALRWANGFQVNNFLRQDTPERIERHRSLIVRRGECRRFNGLRSVMGTEAVQACW